jgi:hypothetical protein
MAAKVLKSWWARVWARHQARVAARRHLAVVAHALFTGSTASYELTELSRVDNSTEVDWDV